MLCCLAPWCVVPPLLLDAVCDALTGTVPREPLHALLLVALSVSSGHAMGWLASPRRFGLPPAQECRRGPFSVVAQDPLSVLSMLQLVMSPPGLPRSFRLLCALLVVRVMGLPPLVLCCS